jgi:hypothetical protein
VKRFIQAQMRLNYAVSKVSSARRALIIEVFKTTAFAIVYGLILINWIDLFNPSSRMPGYDVWLLSMYFAPYFLIMIYRGLKIWPLALAFGLLTSLINDLFYYPIGNLFFGFHVNLISWYSSQLGFDGSHTVMHFYPGFSAFAVSSVDMGLFIYARIGIVLFVIWRYYVANKKER